MRRAVIASCLGLILSATSVTAAFAWAEPIKAEDYDKSYYRVAYFCTDEELARFPDRGTNAPLSPEMGRNYQFSPERTVPYIVGGVVKGVIQGQAACKESVSVPRKDGDAAYAQRTADLKARHPGARSFTWYYASYTPFRLGCDGYFTQAIEIFHAGAPDKVVEPPKTDPVQPKTSKTDPAFVGVAGGNMSDGLTRGGSSTGRTGFAEMNRMSFCRRDNRSGEALSRCLEQFK